jgi:hypothetical protein|tara:strand:- start:397 stop:561 length:165 start_codon:yes stop_codon:yes gene_type:complete
MRNWELSIGFYPGIVIGLRSYGVLEEKNRVDHVLYLPLVDLCLTIYKDHDIDVE